MFSRNKSSTAPQVQELYAGYLYKSPNLSKPAKVMKSWRHRFFVLSKVGEDKYQLTYYKNREKREKPLGEIDLSNISLICTGPEKHRMWEWIQKNFKCLPSSVLFLRVEDFMPKYARDYFLIGENSEDMNGWQTELLKVIKTQPSQNKITDYDLQQRTRFLSKSQGYDKPDLTEPPPDDDYNIFGKDKSRAISEPIPKSPHYNEKPGLTSILRQSAPPGTRSYHKGPDNILRKLSSVLFTDDDDDDDIQDLLSVFSNTSTNGLESSQDLYNAADNPGKRAELMCSKGSLSDFNGNCASEMNNGPPNKSDTLKPIMKEICINRNDVNKGLIFTQEEGKPCVSECKQIETSHLFHKRDQILALNDMEIETVEEIQTFLKRLSRNEVKLTVLRHPGSQPFYAELCSSY